MKAKIKQILAMSGITIAAIAVFNRFKPSSGTTIGDVTGASYQTVSGDPAINMAAGVCFANGKAYPVGTLSGSLVCTSEGWKQRGGSALGTYI